MSSFILFVTLLAIYVVYRFFRFPRNYPSGPWCVPILGYFPFMGSQSSHFTFAQMKKKFGNIFSVQLGMLDCVVVHGWELVSEVHKDKEFVGVPGIISMILASGSEHSDKRKGLMFTDYQPWSKIRKVCVQGMKSSGFERSKMEPIIQDHINVLCEDLKLNNGEWPNFYDRLHTMYYNIVWDMLLDTSFHDEKRKKRILEIVASFFNSDAMEVALVNFTPFLYKVVLKFGLFGIHKLKAEHEELLEMIMDIIKDHRQDLNSLAPRDVIDKMIVEGDMAKGTPDGPYLDDETIQHTMLGLIITAGHTTTNTIRWSLMYLLSNPQVKRRVEEEIDKELGSDPPTLSDASRLPYLQAVIAEVERMEPLFPVIFRRAGHDVQLGGKFIPKDTCVISNVYDLHYDDNVFPCPREFRPERFLDESTCHLAKSRTMVFGHGKRRCIGEDVAIGEVFLTLARLLQQFDFSTNIPAETLLGQKKDKGITTPAEHTLVFTQKDKFKK